MKEPIYYDDGKGNCGSKNLLWYDIVMADDACIGFIECWNKGQDKKEHSFYNISNVLSIVYVPEVEEKPLIPTPPKDRMQGIC